jgi:hypothetical protein
MAKKRRHCGAHWTGIFDEPLHSNVKARLGVQTRTLQKFHLAERSP